MPWMVCLLAGLFVSFGYFQRVAPSVMAQDLMRDLDISAVLLGNLAAAYFYAYGLMQVPAGIMLDRLGPRRVLTSAALLCALGTLGFAAAVTMPWAYGARLLVGATAGFSLVGAFKLASMWFPPRRLAFAAGVASALGTAGGILGQAPLAALVQLVGWREALAGTAIAGIVLAVAFWRMVRDDIAPVLGWEGRTIGAVARVKRILALRQVWFVAATSALLVPTLMAFAALWGVPYMMQAYGLERPAAAAATSLVLVGFGAATPLIGWWSDRLGRRKPPLFAGILTATAGLGILIYVPGLPVAVAYVLCLAAGIGTSAAFLALATGCEHGPAGETGTVVGVINTTNMVAGAVFQPLVGWILDLNWEGLMVAGARVYSAAAFQMAFLPLIASQVAALLFAFRIRETYCRPSA